MVGVTQKIKDALTPGHKHHADVTHTAGTHTAVTGAGIGGVPMQEHYTHHNAAVRQDLGNVSTTSSDSSLSDANAVVTTTTVARAHEGGDVCGRREFVEVEDRPVVLERVERVVEHHPVEKRYVVETRPVGERELREGRVAESLGVTERVVDRAVGSKCPTTTAGQAAAGACVDGSCPVPTTRY